jgi:hypothetical protein
MSCSSSTDPVAQEIATPLGVQGGQARDIDTLIDDRAFSIQRRELIQGARCFLQMLRGAQGRSCR